MSRNQLVSRYKITAFIFMSAVIFIKILKIY